MNFGRLTRAVFARYAIAQDTEAKDENVYVAPSTKGLHWVETFDGDAMSNWVVSGKEKYEGKPEVAKRRVEGLIGDVGLLMPDAAQHYGISTSFPELSAGRKGETFIFQFEVRFQDGLQCGGSYVKLFDRSGKDPTDFDNDTPYIIMFGPDRCGATDKIHFILQHKNPKNGKWEEKHFKEPPSLPKDEQTHIYQLLIKPDNSFQISVDGSSKASGNLLTSMEPPVNPPKEIDDPSDSKPTDWIEDPKMADPESKKPDDWDEDEPRMINDPDATMPDGWLEEAEKRIEDPGAKRPDDWDDDEDGEWEAPTIDNPACKVGCGKWSPPKISNPKYKGKWTPEMIDNPSYIGVWKPRQIDNPDYFFDEEPSVLPKMDALGIDIWTMQGGLLYDNFLIAKDVAKVADFTSKTFDLRKVIEKSQNPSSSGGGFVGGIMETIAENKIPVAVTVVLILAATFFFCCRGDSSPPPPRPKTQNGSKTEEKEREAKEDQSKDDGKKEEKEPEAKKDDSTNKINEDKDAAGVGLGDKKDD